MAFHVRASPFFVVANVNHIILFDGGACLDQSKANSILQYIYIFFEVRVGPKILTHGSKDLTEMISEDFSRNFHRFVLRKIELTKHFRYSRTRSIMLIVLSINEKFQVNMRTRYLPVEKIVFDVC